MISKYFKSFNNAHDQHSFLKKYIFSHSKPSNFLQFLHGPDEASASRNCMGDIFASNQCPNANGVAMGTFIVPKMKYLMYI
jgi:hypothetical protein